MAAAGFLRFEETEGSHEADGSAGRGDSCSDDRTRDVCAVAGGRGRLLWRGIPHGVKSHEHLQHGRLIRYPENVDTEFSHTLIANP